VLNAEKILELLRLLLDLVASLYFTIPYLCSSWCYSALLWALDSFRVNVRLFALLGMGCLVSLGKQKYPCASLRKILTTGESHRPEIHKYLYLAHGFRNLLLQSLGYE